MSQGKPIRLTKAAKEFNVGVPTIVEFLSKKGYEISRSPNTKLTPEMYEILLNAFQSEKNVKEESKKIGIGSFRKETISIDEEKKQDETAMPDTEADKSEEVDDTQQELIIKDVNIERAKDEVQNKEEKKKEKPIEKKEEASGLKILGKIALDEQKEKKIKEEKAEKAEKKKEEETKIEKEKKKSEQLSLDLEEKGKEEKPDEVSGETKEEKEKVALKPAPKILGKIDLKEKKKTTKEEKKAEAKKEEKSTTEDKKQEISKKVAQEDPAEKPAEEKKESITEKPEVEQKEEKAEPKEKENDNFIRTEYKKLDGPRVLGKIDIPDKKEKAPKSEEDKNKYKKKKKRKRIKKEAAPVPAKRAQDSKDKASRQKKPIKKEAEQPEISHEEIEKQIKETLARMSGSGKSKSVKYRKQKREQAYQNKQKEIEEEEKEKKILSVTEFISANELSSLMDVPVTEVIATCMNLGLTVSINQRLDAETISILTSEFRYEVEFVSAEDEEEEEEIQDDEKDLVERSPIVTVMGHVDHGKTSLLDSIRKTNVIEGEAGGITQHVGAYEVVLDNDKRITFLDTPGHEAFTAMRARGAKVTDIVIVVVSADDNVMPQTEEAINHAQAAGVPIIIAINKIDKPNANPEKIKEALANINILVEDWGGKYQSQEISAKKGINLDHLLEKVLLEADMLELKANPNRKANGTVIESSLDKGRGYVCKLLVQNGTLKKGDIVLAGSFYGKVKAMYNERNVPQNEIGPSQPVLMLGLNGAPQAGDTFKVMDNEQETKNIANRRLQISREQGMRTQKHITLDEIGRRIAIGDFKELNIIVKGDVDGSIEALSDSLLKLSTDEVQVNVIHKSVGQVTEADVLLASASNAVIIGFQVRPSGNARKLAEQEQIDIRLYSVIYQAVEEIKAAIEGMLSPEIKEEVVSNIEVREVFKISKVGMVAGCMVLDGKINRNTKIRIIRDGIVIHTGKLGSLKRFKEDVKEVQAGYECGLNIESYNDIKVGDIIEGYQEKEIKRKLV